MRKNICCTFTHMVNGVASARVGGGGGNLRQARFKQTPGLGSPPPRPIFFEPPKGGALGARGGSKGGRGPGGRGGGGGGGLSLL